MSSDRLVPPPTTPDDDDRRRFLDAVRERAVVRGDVVLSSGARADLYVDLRRVTLAGDVAPVVGRLVLAVARAVDAEVVGGLTLGADPVAAAALHAAAAAGSSIDACVVRKDTKQHGLQRRVEGPDVTGRRVLVVEDTSTTGGSALTAADALTAEGALVVGVLVLLDRGARARVEAAGFDYRAVLTLDDLALG